MNVKLLFSQTPKLLGYMSLNFLQIWSENIRVSLSLHLGLHWAQLFITSSKFLLKMSNFWDFFSNFQLFNDLRDLSEDVSLEELLVFHKVRVPNKDKNFLWRHIFLQTFCQRVLLEIWHEFLTSTSSTLSLALLSLIFYFYRSSKILRFFESNAVVWGQLATAT